MVEPVKYILGDSWTRNRYGNNNAVTQAPSGPVYKGYWKAVPKNKWVQLKDVAKKFPNKHPASVQEGLMYLAGKGYLEVRNRTYPSGFYVREYKR